MRKSKKSKIVSKELQTNKLVPALGDIESMIPRQSEIRIDKLMNFMKEQ